jgi:hypothetical protein
MAHCYSNLPTVRHYSGFDLLAKLTGTPATSYLYAGCNGSNLVAADCQQLIFVVVRLLLVLLTIFVLITTEVYCFFQL